MKPFTKNSKAKQSRKKKRDNQRKLKKLYKYRTPSDVWQQKIMPVLLILGVFLILITIPMSIHTKESYQKKIMAESMNYKQELPILNGNKTSKGTLELGHTLLSKDGKTLAVEIIYDNNAHQSLPSFGNRYKLRMAKQTSDKHRYQMSYGMFGTDGSGVLQIHSKNGFSDRSFIAMIIDDSRIVTSDNLNSASVPDDADIDKSITAQLSGDQDSNSATTEDDDSMSAAFQNQNPVYYVRLNAFNAKHNYRNWDNDADMVNDLFVKSNLKKFTKAHRDNQKKLKDAYASLKEMNHRLTVNPKDTNAAQSKEDLKSSVRSLKDSTERADKNYKYLKKNSFNKNVLEPKQTKYHVYLETNHKVWGKYQHN